MGSTTASILADVSEYILNPIITLAFAVALVVFFWGVIEFLAYPADAEKRQNGKKNLVYGVIGFAIMVGVFGILNLIVNSLGIGGEYDFFIF